MPNLLEQWTDKFQKRNLWRDRSLNRYIDSIADLEVKEILKNSLNGTIPVALYGKSQVGKTTFLLKLMGIKDECLSNIHDILRCGSKPGTAATPTAMIYKRTTESKFKIHYSKCIKEFCDEIGIREELIELRKNVESQDYQQNEEIIIEIPELYFNNNYKFNVQVCDLPGIDSSNEKERAHVEKIVKKFIPLSSLILVFQIGNDINDVSNLFNNSVMSEIYGWKYLANRYRLIITRAYSAQSVVTDIKNNNLHLTTNEIKQFYREQANNDINNSNNVPEEVNIFLFELGDSLENELPLKYNEFELNAINEIMNSFWDEILNDIKVTSETGNVTKRISEIPSLLKKLIEDKEIEFDKEKNRINEEISQNNNLIRSYEINNENLYNDIKDIDDRISHYHSNIPYFTTLEDYSGWKNRGDLLYHIDDEVIKKFKNQLSSLFDVMQFSEKDSWSSQVDDSFNDIKEEIRNLKLNTPIIGLFGGPDQKHIDILKEKISNFNKKIKNYYNPEIDRIKNHFINGYEDEKSQKQNKITENNKMIETYNNEVANLIARLNTLKEEYEQKITCYKKEYEQKSDILVLMKDELSNEIQLIKSKLTEKQPIEAFLDLMYMGLIIKEYEKQTKFN